MREEDKRRKREYKEGRRESGVFQIRNTASGKVFVASGLDLPGVMNRHRFELTKGSHMNARLQADWDELGGEGFAFEVLDQLGEVGGTEAELRGELAFLEELWLDRLKPFGERGYNEPKRGREEKLRRIAANRRGSGS